MSKYNYPANYRSGAEQTPQTSQQQSTAYYNSAHPAASFASQYQAQTATSVPDRYQYPHAPAYGTYNKTSYNTGTTGQEYPSYASGTQNPQHSQAQDTDHVSIYSHPRAGTKAAPATQSYYSQQEARQNNSTTSTNTASRAQYLDPNHSIATAANLQQRYDSSTQRQSSPHWQAGQQSTTSNQYSNVRAESSQRNAFQAQPESRTTVDPSQVYDNTHERLRLAELVKAETAKRLREQEDAKKAEEARKAEAAERERKETEARQAVEEGEKKKAAESKKKPKDDWKMNKPKRKSKNAESLPSDDNQMQAAAMTLMRTANANGTDGTTLEAQMKGMFKKMREFNQMDPEMLSRLWQQERDDHLAKETGSTPAAASPSVQHSQASASATKAKSVKKKTPKKPQPIDSGAQATSTNTTVPSEPLSKSTATPQVIAPDTTVSNTATHARVRNTVWSSDKKAVIAAAASDLLKTMPGNNGHTLPAAEVSLLLDGNPRYEQLCDEIEARGVKVDRSQFAKALLSAVPDINKPRAVQRPTEVSSDQPPPTIQTTEKALAQAEKRLMKGANLLAKKPGRPAKDGSEATLDNTPKQRKVTRVSVASQPPIDPQMEAMNAVKMFVDGQWVEPAQPTPSKSTKDRKQKAQQPKPSDEPGHPTKQDLARKRNFNDLIDLMQQLTDDDDDPYSWNPPAKRLQLEAEQSTQLPTPPNTTVAGHSPSSVSVVNGLAASFSSGQYGSATQNYLASQSNPASAQPTQSSKPITPVIILPRDHPARNYKLINTLDKHHALRRSSYDVRSIARDVLLACGRHPDMRHLNAHLEALKSLGGPIDNTSDLSTFRWDLVDPGGPAPGSGVERLPQPVVPIEIDADDEDSDDDSVLGSAGVDQTVTTSGSTTGYRNFTRDMQPIKQRGRPQKSEPVCRSRPDNTPRPPGRPRHSEGAPGLTNLTGPPPVGRGSYTALRAQQEAASPADAPKKRGRPVGWRKSMMADPSAYKGSAENCTAKPGRKKKSPSPQFQVYKCEWKDCTAKLHNLVTLRAHIHKLHSKPSDDGNYYCQWRDCSYVENAATDATGRVKSSIKLYAFDALQPWNKHVEEKHINPIAWKLGDGPKGGISDNYESDVSESFMSDAHGRRITPRAIPPDENEPPQRQRTIAQKEAEQTRAVAEQRMRDIGPSVDRGGATLVTDKERRGLRDDEDIEMVVDESD